MSLNALKRLTKAELSNMTLEYQNKFDNMLSNINNFRTYLLFRAYFFNGGIYENGISAFSNKENEQ